MTMFNKMPSTAIEWRIFLENLTIGAFALAMLIIVWRIALVDWL